MKIFLGADHRGVNVKKKIIDYLHSVKNLKVHPVDLGTFDKDQSYDYPKAAFAVGKSVAKTDKSFGILICMSGNGQVIAANKVKGAYAALCINKQAAALARQHNNANILVISAKFTKPNAINSIVKEFLTAKFEGGRHLRRFKQIKKIEKGKKV